MIREVQRLVKGLAKRQERRLTPLEIYHLGKDASLDVEELMIYFQQTPDTTTVLDIYHALPIKTMSELAIDGKVLLATTEKKPGKWVSEALALAESAVVNGLVQNEQAALLTYLKEQQG